jgi:hypothetical protein
MRQGQLTAKVRIYIAAGLTDMNFGNDNKPRVVILLPSEKGWKDPLIRQFADRLCIESSNVVVLMDIFRGRTDNNDDMDDYILHQLTSDDRARIFDDLVSVLKFVNCEFYPGAVSVAGLGFGGGLALSLTTDLQIIAAKGVADKVLESINIYVDFYGESNASDNHLSKTISPETSFLKYIRAISGDCLSKSLPAKEILNLADKKFKSKIEELHPYQCLSYNPIADQLREQEDRLLMNLNPDKKNDQDEVFIGESNPFKRLADEEDSDEQKIVDKLLSNEDISKDIEKTLLQLDDTPTASMDTLPQHDNSEDVSANATIVDLTLSSFANQTGINETILQGFNNVNLMNKFFLGNISEEEAEAFTKLLDADIDSGNSTNTLAGIPDLEDLTREALGDSGKSDLNEEEDIYTALKRKEGRRNWQSSVEKLEMKKKKEKRKLVEAFRYYAELGYSGVRLNLIDRTSLVKPYDIFRLLPKAVFAICPNNYNATQVGKFNTLPVYVIAAGNDSLPNAG